MSTQSSEANAVLDDEYPMLLIGRDHRVSYANPRAHQLFGYEHGALHGTSIEQLLAPARRAEVRNVQAVLRGQAPRRWRSLVREANGVTLDVNLGLEPCVDHRGCVVAVKLRCERILRSHPPAQSSFEATSGTRPIPPLPSPSVRPAAPSHGARASMPPPIPDEARGAKSPSTAPLSPRPSHAPTAVRPGHAPTPLRPSRAPAPPSLVRPSVAPSQAPVSVRPSSAPAAPKSGRVAVVRPASPPSALVLTDDGAEQLETALQLLGWLRQRIEANDGPLGDPRERARALIVLNETTELVAQCRCESKREIKARVGAV